MIQSVVYALLWFYGPLGDKAWQTKVSLSDYQLHTYVHSKFKCIKLPFTIRIIEIILIINVRVQRF